MERALNVIQVLPSIADEASGPTYSVLRTCQALRTIGNNVTLATLDCFPGMGTIENVSLFPYGRGPRRLGRSPAMRHWLRARSTSGQVDIVHNRSLWMMPNVYAGWAAREGQCHLVVSPHGTLADWALRRSRLTKGLFWALLQGPAIRRASCFHATSEAEYRSIRHMGFRQPVAIIPHGIDVPPMEPQPPSSRRKLLFLSRIHPVKGIEFLLRAWSVIARQFPDWDLQVVGSGEADYVAEMKELASRLSLARTTFSGPLYGEDKHRAYREAELFVLPTHTENFGLAVAEALAAGTPAIVTRGAPWDGLETHGAGWWIDGGSDALVSCFSRALAESRESLRQRGEKGRQWMRRDFCWERVGLMMHETYAWLLGEAPKPRWVRME